MARKGICKNYANCDTADADTVLEIPDSDDFVCPACKKPLQSSVGTVVGKEFKGPTQKRPWLAWCAGAVIVIGLWLIGTAIVSWWHGDPRIQLSATAVTFPFQQIGVGDGSIEIDVKNTGKSGTLDIREIRSTDPSFTTRKKNYAVRPGQSAKLEVLFKPTSPGSHEAILTLVSDDATQPEVTLRLSGMAGKLGAWWIWDQWENASQLFDG
jgi:hypothetical protein